MRVKDIFGSKTAVGLAGLNRSTENLFKRDKIRLVIWPKPAEPHVPFIGCSNENEYIYTRYRLYICTQVVRST